MINNDVFFSRELAQLMTTLHLDMEERRKCIEEASKAKDFESFVKDINEGKVSFSK
tara:strand:+ start:1036 stop:1203 length:168 start_codon:yes stop_codon:yes gene_type:complete